MKKMIDLIIDTDIGDDIDDALALLFSLKFPEIRLLGVTTVFRNTALRARLAKRILTLGGRGDVPVFAGYGKPYAWTPDLEHRFVQYTDDIMEKACEPDNKDEKNGEEAVNFLIESAAKYGENLTLLAIGPYTNVARAYEKAPEIMKKCRIILMGGCFYEQFIEYNVAMDPEACDFLMQNADPVFVSADVTWKAQLTDAQTSRVLEVRTDDLAGYCAELVRLWKTGCWFNPVLHDPLALYYAVDPSVCETEEVWTAVELKGEHARGLTANLDHFVKYQEHKTSGKKRILCTRSVDAERFLRVFLQKTFGVE